MMVVHDISMPALPWSPDRIAVRVAARHLADSPRGPGADPAVAASVDDAVDAPQSWGFSSTVKEPTTVVKPANRRRSPPADATDDAALLDLVRAIVASNGQLVLTLLRATPALAKQSFATGASRASPAPYYLAEIEHYIYAGDTALHLAAAAYNQKAVLDLLESGARRGAANRRGAQPIHYAADGGPTLSTWNPRAQEETVTSLIEAGADPNVVDTGGSRRCTVRYAVDARGRSAHCWPRSRSGPSEQERLDAGRSCSQTTGRGGTGTADAKREQIEILRSYAVGNNQVELAGRSSADPLTDDDSVTIDRAKAELTHPPRLVARRFRDLRAQRKDARMGRVHTSTTRYRK